MKKALRMESKVQSTAAGKEAVSMRCAEGARNIWNSFLHVGNILTMESTSQGLNELPKGIFFDGKITR